MLDIKKKLNNLKAIPNLLYLKNLKHSKIQKTCPGERYGSGYGGWVICPKGLTKTSIIYSFGTGEDTWWDGELIVKRGGETYQ